MAHCPIALLDDLADVFAQLRSWPDVLEKRPGVFYVHHQPFLHFHLLEGDRRRADVKTLTGWVQFDLPRPLRDEQRQSFLRELRARHAKRAKGSGAQKRGRA